MLRKLVMLVCLLSFSPVAAGAQELAVLANAQPAVAGSEATPPRELNLMPSDERTEKLMVASSQAAGDQAAEEQRPRRSHEGMSFKEFADVHFGGYRWVYWVGAVAAIVALHVVVAD